MSAKVADETLFAFGKAHQEALIDLSSIICDFYYLAKDHNPKECMENVVESYHKYIDAFERVADDYESYSNNQ